VQQSTPVGKDADGFELPPVAELVYWCPCREQPLGYNREIRGANGESYYCSSIVFVDKDIPKIEYGTRIEVREDGGFVKLAGEVKRFSKDMMHVRIWV
jgi:hypothetical protein